MVQALAGTERYLAAFEAFEARAAAANPSWLGGIRRAAIARFAELGFPTTREEDWRYTNVAPIAAVPFQPVLDRLEDGIGARAIEPFLLGDDAWTRLVFVDGAYSPKLSSAGRLVQGVRVGSLAEALVADTDVVTAHLTRQARDNDGFTALSTAFFRDGAFVHVPQGTLVETPIHLLFIVTSRETGERIMAQPRNLIVAGPGSRATIVESYVSLSVDPSLTNVVTEVIAGNGAVLDHYRLQQESESAFHVGTFHVRQERDSTFSATSITLGGRLVRNTLQMLFGAEGATCALNGLYVIGGRQHVDNHITVDHAKPQCASRQLYKGILDGKSSAVFNGRILVRRGAQKTDAHQTNKNLLLSDGPEVNSKPWLEIFADDVRCTHGAADGQLAEEAIFYLKSRGLSDETARTLLTYGFANEVIERIRVEPLRAHLDRLLMERLQKGLASKETS